MDDIHDLLSEVEGALSGTHLSGVNPTSKEASLRSAGSSQSLAAPHRAAPSRESSHDQLHVQNPSKQHHSRTSSGRSAVDDLLSLIDDSGPPLGEAAAPRRPSIGTSATRAGSTSCADSTDARAGAPSAGSKCSSVYLGVPSSESGQTRSTAKRYGGGSAE
jgi:hypothetical protein